MRAGKNCLLSADYIQLRLCMSSYSKEFCDTILWLLQQDPTVRPRIYAVEERIKQLKEGRFVFVASSNSSEQPIGQSDQGGWATF